MDMTSRLICAAVLAASAAAAQTTTSSPPTASKKNETKPVTVTGCVAEDPSHAGTFMLADITTGSTTYRVAGKDIRQYLGKRVSITGAALPPKTVIAGGLTPSPNVAAQAGAIDPARAAMAAQGAEGNTKPGQIEIPEIRARSVKPVAGDCQRR
jgi:hypothetical protein